VGPGKPGKEIAVTDSSERQMNCPKCGAYIPSDEYTEEWPTEETHLDDWIMTDTKLLQLLEAYKKAEKYMDIA